MNYRYDGSFAGLLTVLHRAFSWREEVADIQPFQPVQETLFDDAVRVETDLTRVDALLSAIRTHLSAETELFVRHAFFSETRGVEMLLYRYLALGWKLRRALDRHIAHPDVNQVHRTAQRVRSEAYRFKGLLRFRETQDGVFYAPMEPDHFILSLVAPHFSVRLAKERWLIHDVRREKGVLYDGGGWILADLELEESPVFTDAERHWQHLWQTFFRRIA
ncbi:MAG TPA: DNA metabolism protein, partial [Geoalkalibacter subterraneus]|nr:DNA metabolism protein [Geoalkalibacter subterraneus]